jgi:hypothetical protein
MMFWQKHPDGYISRKLMKDWNEEEKALHARHGAFVKEAEALGYVFSFDGDTLKWIGRFAPERPWVGLTDDEIDRGLVRTNYAMQTAGAWRDGVEWAQSQLKEKNG